MPTYINSNLSPLEVLRVLPEVVRVDDYPCIAQWAEAAEDAETNDISGALINLEEAAAMYEDEDFLQPVVLRLFALAKRLRGNNSEEARAIAGDLEHMQATIAQSAEYGREKIASAVKIIETRGE